MDGQRYWYSPQPTVTRLAAGSGRDRSASDDVDEEIRRRLRATRRPAGRLRQRPRLRRERRPRCPDEPEARLVVLGPEHPHSAKTAEQPGTDIARAIARQAQRPATALHRNMLVFLAPDTARLEELRDAGRNCLAWQTIGRDTESLNLDSVQRSQVESRIGEWEDAVTQRVGEAYQWLLAPSGSAGDSEIRWEATRVGGSDPLAVRASRKLRTEEGLIVAYSGARLRMDLDRIPLWREDHLAVRDLWSYYSQYLYLPRLRGVEVLLEAIVDGVGQLDWAKDGLAFSDSWDEAASRYVGLRGGESIALQDPAGIVVKPGVASEQLGRDRAEPAEPAGSDVSPSAPTPSGSDEVPEPDAAPRSFYGQVDLDPLRVSRDAGQVAEAIVQHLSGLLGAEVKVRLEIEAEAPEGVPEDVVRTVTENARTLKFTSHGFEGE